MFNKIHIKAIVLFSILFIPLSLMGQSMSIIPFLEDNDVEQGDLYISKVFGIKSKMFIKYIKYDQNAKYYERIGYVYIDNGRWFHKTFHYSVTENDVLLKDSLFEITNNLDLSAFHGLIEKMKICCNNKCSHYYWAIKFRLCATGSSYSRTHVEVMKNEVELSIYELVGDSYHQYDRMTNGLLSTQCIGFFKNLKVRKYIKSFAEIINGLK